MSENPKNQIAPESVYREMYNEARRHRDHQFTESTWFSALLLGVIGFLITARFGSGNTAQRGAELISNCLVRWAVMVLCFFIAAVSTYLVWACHQRYDKIRKWLDENLEPDFKRATFKLKPAEQCIRSHWVYYITPWFAVVIIGLILFA